MGGSIFMLKVNIFSLVHAIKCGTASEIEIAIPTKDHIKETGNNKVYITCHICGKSHCIASVSDGAE